MLGCNHTDRLPASLLMKLKSDCPCCSLYRALAVGLAFGFVLGAVATIALLVML